jgi:hypothetical protein
MAEAAHYAVESSALRSQHAVLLGGARAADAYPDALGGPWPPPRVMAILDDLARNDDSGRYLSAAVGSNHRWHQDCGRERDLLSGGRLAPPKSLTGPGAGMATFVSRDPPSRAAQQSGDVDRDAPGLVARQLLGLRRFVFVSRAWR